MAFQEVRLDVSICYGFEGGPEFDTRIVTLDNGLEKRNQNRTRARHRYVIAHDRFTRANYLTLRAFFYGCGDYWAASDGAEWGFGAVDFTVECWVRCPAATAGVRCVVSQYNTTSNQRAWAFQVNSTGTILFGYSTDGSNFTTASSTGAISANTWHHIAAVRNGTSLTVYIDGVGGTPVTIGASSIFDSNSNLRIGALVSGGAATNFMDGWIDEMRISKGLARYTANFTPPSAPFADS